MKTAFLYKKLRNADIFINRGKEEKLTRRLTKAPCHVWIHAHTLRKIPPFG